MKTKKLLPQEGTMLPNEATLRKPTIPFPVLKAENVVLPEERKPFWLVRFGLWIGTLMVRPDSPKGWGWNPSVITLCVVIGGILFTAGMYVQESRSDVKYLQRELDAAKRMAESSKRESTYAAAKVDGGHAVKPSPDPTPTPEGE